MRRKQGCFLRSVSSLYQRVITCWKPKFLKVLRPLWNCWAFSHRCWLNGFSLSWSQKKAESCCSYRKKERFGIWSWIQDRPRCIEDFFKIRHSWESWQDSCRKVRRNNCSNFLEKKLVKIWMSKQVQKFEFEIERWQRDPVCLKGIKSEKSLLRKSHKMICLYRHRDGNHIHLKMIPSI